MNKAEIEQLVIDISITPCTCNKPIILCKQCELMIKFGKVVDKEFKGE